MKQDNKPQGDRNLEGAGWTARFTSIVFIAYLIIPAMSYSLGCLNAPSDLIKDFMNQTELERTGTPMSEEEIDSLFGLLVAVVGIGAGLASTTSSALCDKIGRIPTIVLSAVIGGVGVLVMALCQVGSSYEMLFVGRTLVGLGLGWGITAAPTYVVEICQPGQKGAAGMANLLMQSFAFLLTQVLGYEEILGNNEHWDLLLGFPLLFIGIQLVGLLFCPESPRYLLINKNDEEGARKSFQRIHGIEDVEIYMDELRREHQESATETQVSVVGLFKSKLLRRPLLITIVLGLQQNWCGMNTIMFFSNDLFRDAGITGKTARYATSGTGGLFFLGTIVAFFLLPRFGRKTLFIGGTLGITLCTAILPFSLLYKDDVDGLKYVNIVVSLAIIAFYALGPVCVFWVILGEIFPHSARGSGFSVLILCAFIGFFTHGYALPQLRDLLQSFTFFVFTVIDILTVIFCVVYMPETRNKNFVQVVSNWASPEDLAKLGQTAPDQTYTDMEITIPASKRSDDVGPGTYNSDVTDRL